MPLKLSREDRRLAIVAIAIFAASTLAAIILSPKQSESEYATSYSSASEGAKAAYLLLQESGYRVERWQRPPAELRDPAGTLLILTDPSETPTQADKDALAKFVSSGGTLLLAGPFSPIFVSEPGPMASPLSLGWQTFPALAPSPQAFNAPEIRLDETAYWLFAKGGAELYGDDTRQVVVQYPRGKGTIVWLASSTLINNAGLRESNNLEFLLSTVGSKSRRVLWDEYFHGYRDSGPSPMSHPQLVWLYGQLGFIAVAVLVTFSRRSGPQRAPREQTRLSPLEYVRALGELYEHAHAANVAVEINYERFRYTLAKRLALRPNAGSEEVAAAVAQRWKIDRQDFRNLLDVCESSRFYEDLSQKEALALVQRLHEYSVELKLFPEAVEEKQ